MRTGIVVALSREAKTLRCLRGDDRFLIRVSGAGPANARRAAQALLDVGCERLISWGMAGALEENLRIGELIEPRRVRSLASGDTVSIDDAPCDLTLVSASNVVGSADKPGLRADGAAAVDMESHAVGVVCAGHGAGFHVCRAIVDTATDRWIDRVSGLVDDTGRVRLRPLAVALLRHPGALRAAARAQRVALATLEKRARRLQETGR